MLETVLIVRLSPVTYPLDFTKKSELVLLHVERSKLKQSHVVVAPPYVGLADVKLVTIQKTVLGGPATVTHLEEPVLI